MHGDTPYGGLHLVKIAGSGKSGEGIRYPGRTMRGLLLLSRRGEGL